MQGVTPSACAALLCVCYAGMLVEYSGEVIRQPVGDKREKECVSFHLTTRLRYVVVVVATSTPLLADPDVAVATPVCAITAAFVALFCFVRCPPFPGTRRQVHPRATCSDWIKTGSSMQPLKAAVPGSLTTPAT